MKFKDLVKEDFTFPDGSYHCKLDDFLFPSNGWVRFEVQDFDFVKLATQVDAVRRTAFHMDSDLKLELFIPYIPSARQDRLCDVGEPFTSKVVAGLINSLKFDKVITLRPHSDVMPALINNLKVMDISDTSVGWVFADLNVILVAPDIGASKATQKLGMHYRLPVVQAFKD